MSEYSKNLYGISVQVIGRNKWFSSIETREYIAKNFEDAAKKAESDGLKKMPRQNEGLVYEIKLLKNLVKI